MEHRHHGVSSASFLDSSEILDELNFNGDETFMDAGCGDGYIAIKALGEYLPNGKVFAVDMYEESIIDLEKFKNENSLDNLVNINADITDCIPGVDDESVDVVLMLNVFHGFKASGQMDQVIDVFNKIIKKDGRIAIMDFKQIDMQKGPPTEIRCSPEELEKIFKNHNLKKIHLNEDIGEDLGQVKSHYMIIFKKE